MADIELRFHKDLLVLSAPTDAALVRQGFDIGCDREFLNLLEPETLFEIAKLESMAGAQCLVTDTAGITRARLSHARLEDQSADIAQASLKIIDGLKPQHAIALIGPTFLPIDAESKSSLKQNRDQYAQAARDFGDEGFDAFLLDGMVSLVDLKCALMGVRMVSSKPIMASVTLDGEGKLTGRAHSFLEAIAVMEEFEADVIGFATAAPIEAVLPVVEKALAASDLPLLVQLVVGEHTAHDLNSGFRPVVLTQDNPYRTPDAVLEAGMQLTQAGVQFLRAVGQATASYTGALAIATDGRDCLR